MPEVSDQNLKVLQGAYKLLDGLLRNPQTTQQAQALLKATNPNIATAQDYAKPFTDALVATNKKIDDFIAGQSAKAIDTQLATDYATLRQEGWTDDGLEALKKFQLERRIPNPIDAAAAYERRNPPPPQEPSLFAPSDWGIGAATKDEDLGLLYKDEDAWANREVARALHDFRRGQDWG